jgi:hypothetical protein
MVSKWVAFHIQQKQSAASEEAQRRDHVDHSAIGKMVQYRRAKNEIEATPGERKLKRIRHHPRGRGVTQV